MQLFLGGNCCYFTLSLYIYIDLKCFNSIFHYTVFLRSKLNITPLVLGLTAGARYKISLYAVTTGGVSSPSSTLVYSKEQSKA